MFLGWRYVGQGVNTLRWTFPVDLLGRNARLKLLRSDEGDNRHATVICDGNTDAVNPLTINFFNPRGCTLIGAVVEVLE